MKTRKNHKSDRYFLCATFSATSFTVEAGCYVNDASRWKGFVSLVSSFYIVSSIFQENEQCILWRVACKFKSILKENEALFFKLLAIFCVINFYHESIESEFLINLRFHYIRYIKKPKINKIVFQNLFEIISIKDYQK